MCATVFYLVGRIGFHIYEANIHSMIICLCDKLDELKFVFNMEKYF